MVDPARHTTDASIPQWAADLRVSVAEIRGRVEQIPELGLRLEELRANTPPMAGYLELVQKVDVLWDRDLSARDAWTTVLERNKVLWEERTEQVGARRTYRYWLGALSLAVVILTAFSLLHGLGLSITTGGR